MDEKLRSNIEQFVLGALIYKNDNFDVVRNIISKSDFQSEIHKEIYGFIDSKLANGNAVDLITLMHFMAKKEIDKQYLEDINNAGKSCSNVIEYCNILREMSLSDQLVRIGHTIDQQYKDGKLLSDRIKWVENAINGLNYVILKDDYVSFNKAAIDTIDSLHELLDKKITYMQSGFVQLDGLLQGLRPGELVCVAGRPAVGKTTFSLQWPINSSNRKKTMFISLEMSGRELCLKVLSNLLRIPLSAFTTGRITTNTLHECLNFVYKNEIPLIIYDSCHLNINGLRSIIAKSIRCEGVEVVIIDYLQLITSNNRETREQEISEISRSLKLLAKEFGIPIIATCQLSREVEKQGRKPRLSDMRGSGAIEQDADKVIILYADQENNNKIEAIVAKNRNGPTGSVFFIFDKEVNRFYESNDPATV
jgi:replicative DNA helicase